MQAVLLAGGFSESAQTGQVLLFRKINSDTAEVRKLNLTNYVKPLIWSEIFSLNRTTCCLCRGTKSRKFPDT